MRVVTERLHKPEFRKAALFLFVVGATGVGGGCSDSTTPAQVTNDRVETIIGPAGGTVVTPSGAAGVQIPAGTFSQQVLVSVTQLPSPPTPGTGPLSTTLKQYPPYYEFATTPVVAQFGDSVRVGVCQVSDPASPLYPPEATHDRLRLAHTVGATIEVLDRVGVTDFLRCTNVVANSSRGRGSLAAFLSRVAEFVQPRPLYASHGGLGGKVKSFSPFGAVDPLSGPVASVTITPSTSQVIAGQSENLTAVTADAAGTALTGRTVTWTSSDNSVATVSPTGATAVVTGIVAGGPVTVTATSEGKTASASVTIVPAVNVPIRGLGPALSSIDLGESHGCGLDASGNAYCWGANSSGELGDGTTSDRSAPTAVVMPAGITFKAISAGGATAVPTDIRHTCALSTAGTAYCWGSIVGDGSFTIRLIPTQVTMPSGVTFTSISAGPRHTCALTAAGAAYCWGFAPTSTTSLTVPTAQAAPAGVAFSAISAGFFQTCAIATNGVVYCAGGNMNGILGDGTTTDRIAFAPIVMPAGQTFTKIAATWLHTCALTSSGVVYCWGLTQGGRLGEGTLTQAVHATPAPVTMPVGVTFTSISASNTHSCALSSTGVSFCWGENSSQGQLATGEGDIGDGTTTNRAVPTPAVMPSGVSFTSLSIGTSFTCALTASGARYCWGANARGQRGDGTTLP